MTRVVAVIGSVFLGTLLGCGSGTAVNLPEKGSRPQHNTGGTTRKGSRLVGTWRFVRSSNNQEPDWGTKLDFTSDGKVAMHAVGYANAGTYALEGNILKINTAVTRTLTVAKLTDRELVLELQLAPVPGNTATFEYRKE